MSMTSHGDLDPRPPAGILPGEWDPPPLELSPARHDLERITLLDGAAYQIPGLLSPAECALLIDAMNRSGQASPVNIQGRQDIPDARIGSVRATAWAPQLAPQLWHKLAPYIPALRTTGPLTPTDWHLPTPHYRWRAIGVSPVLRFMRYEDQGEHYAHYDAAYDYKDGRRRTLMSLVLYLTTAPQGAGGHIRFIRDHQEQLPIWERDHEDWIRRADEDEVIEQVRPVEGSALVFDHRLCHDVELYRGQTPRIIIRGDIIYEALD